jgi:uncharacterized integral membrane protein
MMENEDPRRAGPEGQAWHDAPAAGTSAKSGKQGPSALLIALIVVAVLAFIFIIQNSRRVEVQFMFFNHPSRLWLALLITFVLGAACGQLAMGAWRRRKAGSESQRP